MSPPGYGTRPAPSSQQGTRAPSKRHATPIKPVRTPPSTDFPGPLDGQATHLYTFCMSDHEYSVCVEWTGNLGTGTSGYRAYSRDHDVRGTTTGPPVIHGSADPAFRGDAHRWNPEQLLLASLSQCHMLWYLHLAADAGVTVTAYSDTPTGIMVEHPGGTGEFTSATLRPTVTIAPGSDPERAAALHDRAAEYCFIARSVNFPVHHEADITTGQERAGEGFRARQGLSVP